MIKKKNKLAAAAVALMLAAQVAGCGEKDALDTTGSGVEKTETENSVSEPVQMEDTAGREEGNDSGIEGDADSENEPEYEDYEIEWKDSLVKKAVQQNLQIWDREIMLSDVLGIKELDFSSVAGYDDSVGDLSDLAVMENLERLKLSSAGVSLTRGFDDVSSGNGILGTNNFSVFAELPKLQELDLGTSPLYEYGDVYDISGLPAMQSLTSFTVGGYYLEDISVLLKYPNLTELTLAVRDCHDMSVLSQLNKLESLTLIMHGSLDLSVLNGLTNLKELLIAMDYECGLTGLEALGELGSLESLQIQDDSISNFKLELISKLPNLETLTLNMGAEIEDLDMLADMQGLKRLSLRGSCVEKLPDLLQLEALCLTGGYKKELKQLPNMENLQTLTISMMSDADMGALADLPKLKSLSLYVYAEPFDGNPSPSVSLPDMSELETLALDVNAFPGQWTLSGLPKLKSLSVFVWGGYIDLNDLPEMPNLEELALLGNGDLSDLSGLSGLEQLKTLDLRGGQSLTDLSPLSALSKLEVLNLSGCRHVVDLSPLAGLSNLKTLNLKNCNNIEDMSLVDFVPELILN